MPSTGAGVVPASFGALSRRWRCGPGAMVPAPAAAPVRGRGAAGRWSGAVRPGVTRR